MADIERIRDLATKGLSQEIPELHALALILTEIDGMPERKLIEPVNDQPPPPRPEDRPPKRTGVTTDRSDPRLGYGVDEEPIPQHDVYLVLSAEERSKGFVRPLCLSYVHATELGGCGVETSMGLALSETYARDPNFYGATYCVGCNKHRPVGEDGEFYWTMDLDGKPWKVGT
jgi:hypothetical protein